MTTFASTLDTLLPRRDTRHIVLLTDTVATDLAADASTMANLAARPQIYALADLLTAVGDAAQAADWSTAEANWSEFQAQAAAIEERAY